MSALSSLISGADCGPSNALSSVVKHAEIDRSLQRDRVGGPSQMNLHHLPSSSSQGPSEADQALARQFFDGNAAPPIPPSLSAPFPMILPSQPLAPINQAQLRRSDPAEMERLWSTKAAGERAVQSLAMASAPRNGQWLTEFNTMTPAPIEASRPAGQGHDPMALRSSAYAAGMLYTPQMFSPQAVVVAPATQADWEKEFSRLSELKGDEKGKGRLIEVDDEGKAIDTLEEAFKNATLEQDGEKGNLDDYMKSFEKVWEEVKVNNSDHDLDGLAAQEADYRQLMQQMHELDGTDPDLLAQVNESMANPDDDLVGDFGLNDLDDMTKYDDEGVPILEAYEFEQNNPYLNDASSSGHLARAKELLATNGSLDEAALLIEASIQKGELGKGGYEAWLLLGRARSMDEREVQALRALREGTRIAQSTGDGTTGMLDLAISYTNELHDLAAQHILRQWIRAKYPVMKLAQRPQNSYRSPWSSHELTTEDFLLVTRYLHSKGQMDPEVQVGLGVLFYSNAEYDKARDCFESALQAHLMYDYLMWNRLGSSLSNGSKPEEALGAYREALRLRPTYTRAIYNVGVACLNIGAHKEAAEHFLSALTLRNPDSAVPGGPPIGGPLKDKDQIWQTLKRTFTGMDRPDLIELANIGDVNVFRGEFDF
ncbi:uncharacterized protein EI90DRAFT_2972114 [Cantharellus anzutake]|uniref:uncharacterized protein n=1 Tax=Cantharellus anzutake TaxID=1750568 RepID=UPI0019083991|nr:uncharacterized protein EI90DRAFT_2972114 [Cantharellus anzutake]KAF8332035.1 hypothetical protein EI90DRAFT_2972114 [Cantharellus anzutake]